MMRLGVMVALVTAGGAPAVWAQPPDDNPRRRWEAFYERRAFPFERIPGGALERARVQLEALRAGPAGAPAGVASVPWEPLGPTAIPISLTSTGRMSAIAVHPGDPDVIYVGGAQGGVWKTIDGGASWTPLTDEECSLAMGSIVLDPVDPDIVYAGTGEQHFSGDSYYGCGVLRSEDGGATWTQLGANVFQSAAGGARISRLVVAPTTAGTPATTTVLAASDFGLFRSLDGGATWTETLVGTLGCNNTFVCSATDLVLDPTDDSIVYAAIRTRGVYRSTDRGATWTFMGSGFATSSIGRINLAIAPSTPATLYASVHNVSTSQLLGIWKTTTAGSSWSQLSATGASCGNQCWYDMFVAVDPGNANTVYFGGVQLYKSIDGGATFSNIRGPIHVDQHFFAFHPADPQIVFVANDGGIYRSQNGGGSWTSLNNGLALTQFYEGISLHPTDPTVILGGTQDNGTLLYTGQPTWQHVLGGDGGFTAIDFDDPLIRYAETQWSAGSGFSGPRRSTGDQFFLMTNGIVTSDRALFIPPLVMDPTNSSTLYFGTFRVYRTTDRAENWTAISPDLAGGSFDLSAIAPAPSDPDVIYVGAQSGLVHVSTDGGVTWPPRSAGLPTRFIEDIAVDPSDAQTAYLVVSGFGTGHVFRTVNGGQSWTDVSGGLPDVPVNAVLTDPVSRGLVTIGTDLGIFLSADSGVSWSVLDDGIPNVAVFDLAYHAATDAIVAATHGRGMFRMPLDRSLTLAVLPSARHDTVVTDDPALRADSADVSIFGTGAGGATWAAAAAKGAWVTMVTPNGTGTGKVRWSRRPGGLATGVHVDTIRVTAAVSSGSPAIVVDSLVITTPVSGARADTVLSGDPAQIPVTVPLVLNGGEDVSTAWTATSGAAPWLVLETTSGQGSGSVSWRLSAADLADGTYRDTVEVVTATGDLARVVQTFVVRAPSVARACAGNHLLGTPCLDDASLRWLDLIGNRDGTYNLGDLLALLARSGTP